MMRVFTKVLVWTLCLSLAGVLSVSATVVDDVLLVPMTTEAPEIDGEMDAVWGNVTNTPMNIYVDLIMPEDGWLDHSSSFRVMWDADAYYFFGSVKDTEISTDSPNSYENDSWEIYFDAGNLDSETYVSGNDFQWRYVYGITDFAAGVFDFGTGAWVETDLGYDFELAISQADMPFTLEEDHEFGHEAQVNERDGGVRQTMSKWWGNTNDSWLNPSLFGTAMTVNDPVATDLLVQMTATAPEIDGELDEVWNNVPEVSQNTYVEQDYTLMSGWNDLQFTFRVMWDASAFYFFGSVIDDIISTDSPNSYENDSFEIYFDAGNLKNDTYVTGNDFQWRYVYGITDFAAGVFDFGTGAWVETDQGYDFELAIAQADMPFTLEEDHEFGFEVQVNDRENAARESMAKYWTDSNDSWLNPSLFGTAMTISTDAVKDADRMPKKYNFVDNYPNPFNPQTTIEYQLSKPSQATLSVYNLMGEKVATMVNKAGESQFKFDSGNYNMPSGVYIYRVVAGNEVLTNKMMLVK
jgi:hypothetical protein